MLRLAAVAIAAVVVATAPALAADTFVVDPGHTSAEFAAKHFGISTVRGTIPVLRGSVVESGPNGLPQSVDVTFDLKGLDSHNDRRDNELRTNWFDVAKYPTMQFVSTKIEGTDPADFKIDGNLTLHGVTKPVVLQAKLEGKVEQRGKLRFGYTATTTIDRHDFGVQASGPSDAVVTGPISVTIETEVAQQ